MIKNFKLLSILMLLCIVISSLNMSSYAESNDYRTNCEMDSSVAMVISNQLSDTEIGILSNKEYYDESLKGKNIIGLPILKVYNEIYWNASDDCLITLVSKAEKECQKYCSCEYIVFDSSPYKIRVISDSMGNSQIGICESYSASIPTYINDIINMSNCISNDENVENTIKSIYCFDGTTSHQGIVVYLEAVNGVYIKYYQNSFSEAYTFLEEDYQKYAFAYYEYLTSLKSNYNENGEALGDGISDFGSFVQTASLDEKENSNKTFISVCVCFLIGGIGLVFMILLIVRKYLHKKNQ